MFRIFVLFALFITTPLIAQSQTIAGGMKVGDYSISIGHKIPKYNSYEWIANNADRLGYIKMQHMEVYEIKLKSDFYGYSDAVIEINGSPIGTYRIGGNSEIILERSRNNSGRFTFVSKRTQEFYDANLNLTDPYNLGLIKVKFYPQKLSVSIPSVGIPTYPLTKNKTSFNPGGTAITGQSDQKFKDVAPIERDYNRLVTINIRLIEDERPRYGNEVKPLNSLYYTPQSNDIPAPLE